MRHEKIAAIYCCNIFKAFDFGFGKTANILCTQILQKRKDFVSY